MTVMMLLRARAAPSAARPAGMVSNPKVGNPAAIPSPKVAAMSSGTPIAASTMFWPER